MNGEDVFAMLDRVASAKGASLRQQKSEGCSPSACVPVPRLERGARKDDWTEEEQQHVLGCAACQRTLAIIQRLALLEGLGPPEATEQITEGLGTRS